MLQFNRKRNQVLRGVTIKLWVMVPVKLVIDWTMLSSYNPIMTVVQCAVFYSIARAIKKTAEERQINSKGCAIIICVLDLIPFLTGLLISIYFLFDTAIFLEPILLLYNLLLASAFYCLKRLDRIDTSEEQTVIKADNLASLRYFLHRPRLSCMLIAFAQIIFQLFRAYIEECVTGLFAGHLVLEAAAILGLFTLVGISSLLMPRNLEPICRTDHADSRQALKNKWWINKVSSGSHMKNGVRSFNATGNNS